MPTYHFNVQDGVKYKDLNGTILVDDEAALAEGARVAREVKSGSGSESSDWLVEVKDGIRLVAEIPFTSVD